MLAETMQDAIRSFATSVLIALASMSSQEASRSATSQSHKFEALFAVLPADAFAFASGVSEKKSVGHVRRDATGHFDQPAVSSSEAPRMMPASPVQPSRLEEASGL